MPTTIITTIPTVIETTITPTIPAKTETTTIKTTIPTTIKINMPTNIRTTKLSTRQTTIITNSPTDIQTTTIISKAIPITTQIFSTRINKKTDSSSISKASIPTTIFSTITNIEHIIIPETTIITNIITRSNTITTNIPTPQPTMKPSKIISTTIPIEKIKTTIISTTKPTIFQTNTPFTDPITAPEIINTTIPRINSTEIFTTIIRTTETIINEITSIPSIESIPIKTTNPTFTPSSNSNEIHNPKPIQMTTNILPTLASDEQTNLHSTIQSDLISTNIKSSNKYSLSEIISEQITLNLNSSIPLSLNLISTTLQNNIIPILPTTNIKNNIFSTLIKDTDLIPLKNDEETLLIFLGINRFRKHELFFSFYLFFIAIKNYIYFKDLIFPIIVTYHSNIRLLEELEANCTLQETNMNQKYQYFCRVETETSKIDKIAIIPDFNFVPQENVTIIGITPFAHMYKDNVQTIDEKCDLLDNSTVYILDNVFYTKYNKNSFDIIGSIRDPQPKFKNKNIILMINAEFDKNSIIEVEVGCAVTNITGQNYTLNCKANETFNGDLHSAISFIDDNDILLINFGAYHNSSKINTQIKSAFYIRFFSKISINNKSALIASIIVPIVLTVIIIGIIIYLRRKKVTKSDFNQDSTLGNLKLKAIDDFKKI